MLNGIDPILIFQIYKLLPETAATIASMPLAGTAKKKATYAIIPLYLSEDITGLYIDSESKNIDIESNPDSLISGEPGPINQKNLGAITTINLEAKQNSVGFTILLALSELILDKLASQEYEVTYLHGGITVFGGLIHGFSYDQGTNDDKYRIKLELSRGRPKTKSVLVKEDPSAVRLGSTGAVPPADAPTAAAPVGDGGRSQIQPGVFQSGLR